MVLTASIVTVAAGGSTTLWQWSSEETHAVCAYFDNSFGLYPGAPVTIRGIAIGTVTRVEADGDRVLVGMKTDDRTLPADVGAVIVNASILTDRRVELVDATYRNGPSLPSGHCIDKQRTRVPVSVSDAIESFATLVGKITEPDGNGDLPLRSVLRSAGHEFDGLGPTLNREFRELAELMASPDSFMDQLGKLLDNSAELTTFVTSEWSDIKTTLLTFGPGLESIQRMLVIVKVLVGKLANAIGPMDRIFNEHFPYLMEVLNSTVPVVTLVRTRTENSQDLLMKIPGVITMLRTMIESRPGALSVDYESPQTVVRTPSAPILCAELDRPDNGRCTVLDQQSAAVSLPHVLLSTIGGMP